MYYTFNGHILFQTNRQILGYVLVNEPAWYALSLAFAILVGRSIFRYKMLEEIRTA